MIKKRVVLPVSMAILAATAIFDYFTNSELFITVLYIIPILLVSWYTNFAIAVPFALITAIIMTSINYLAAITHVNSLIYY